MLDMEKLDSESLEVYMREVNIFLKENLVMGVII